jgi:hypothetical protein
MTENKQLDQAAIETIADLNSQIRALNVAKEAVLVYYHKQNKLVIGEWNLAENQQELIKRNGTSNAADAAAAADAAGHATRSTYPE